MDNPFLKRLVEGSIASEDELKALYRKSAKDLHPDTSPFTRDSGAFARLNAHYEEALAWLRHHQVAGISHGTTDARGTVGSHGGGEKPAPAAAPHSPGSPGPGPGTGPARTSAKPAQAHESPGRAGDGPGRDPARARYDFYLALQNLLARTWPFTRGREDKDASLRRHLETAALAWDEWQQGEPGLFARLEACRREKLSVQGGPATSDESVWQSVEAFLFIAAGAGIETSPLNRGLLDHQHREAQMKLKRRLGTHDVSRLVAMVMEDLSSRIPA